MEPIPEDPLEKDDVSYDDKLEVEN